jgi:hypothetical protein
VYYEKSYYSCETYKLNYLVIKSAKYITHNIQKKPFGMVRYSTLFYFAALYFLNYVYLYLSEWVRAFIT